jgi:hypothetical protein
MTAGLKGHALFAGGHGDGGAARGGPDQLHDTTTRGARQASEDFPELRSAIATARDSNDYAAYCAARRDLLLAQAAAYLAGKRER